MIKNQDDHYQRKKRAFEEKDREIRNLERRLKMHQPFKNTQGIDIQRLGIENRLEITRNEAKRIFEELEELEVALKPKAPRILLLAGQREEK